MKSNFQSGVASRATACRAMARGTRMICLSTLALLFAGCRMDMHEQPKYLPYEPTTFFDDGRSERPIVPGTVARGQLRLDELLYTGKENGVLSNKFPFPITRADLERGRQRYNIYCTPCHDYTGSGQGIVVQRGFPPPPSYHIDRMRQAPVGHFFDVITNGDGSMYSYASRIEPEDRWRIAAYIRVLQLSEHSTVQDVPVSTRGRTPDRAESGAIGNELWRAQGLHAYLLGRHLRLMIPPGCTAIPMMQASSTGGWWGYRHAPPAEAGNHALFGVMALLFVPVVIWMKQIYPWVNPSDELSHNPNYHFKLAYLNPNFFILRAIIYFAILMGLAHLLNKWSREPGIPPAIRASRNI